MSELRLSGAENFIPSAEIQARTQELAAYYDELYGRDEVVVLTVLKGATRFAQGLTTAMRNPNIIEDYVRIKSMDGIRSGVPVYAIEPDTHIKGRDVLVVEDIDDTRKSLDLLMPRLRDQSPARLDLVSLLHKPTAEKVIDAPEADDIQYGFDIANRFVVGYGLDWDQRYRSLNHISVAHNVGTEQEPFWEPIVWDETKTAPPEWQSGQASDGRFHLPASSLVAGL